MLANSASLKELLIVTKDGEWGKGEPTPDHREMTVVRGTDFANVRYGSITEAPTRFIPEQIAIRKQLQPQDILIETAGGTRDQPTGRTVFLKGRLFSSSPLPITCASFARFLRVNPELANPEYVFWYLQFLYESGEMEEHQVQHTGISRFQYTKFSETIRIPLPTLAEQAAIAHILSTLDDKIELNRKMNQTLENMARAIFKSWFVDFDPVRAKAEGRDPGLPADLAALFPDSFEDSELGEIPKEWKICGLDQIATYLNGLALQKYPSNGNDFLPVIKIAQLRAGNVEGADRAGTNMPSEYIVEDGDVLFSWSGSLEVEMWCGGRGALNQHLFKVTSDNYPKWFYYLWTRHHLSNFQDIAADKATTMGHIQRRHLSEAKVLVPPKLFFKSMDTVIAPLLDRVIVNRIESRTLAALRDALLPKLLSGEISVRTYKGR